MAKKMVGIFPALPGNARRVQFFQHGLFSWVETGVRIATAGR